MVRNGKERENLCFSSVAATLEKAITYVCAESLIRNAEVRGSIPICSTTNSQFFNYLQGQLLKTQFSQVANTWPEKTAAYGRKR